MAELRVAINFRIPGLWVAREILGRSIEVDRDGFRLVLTIPQLERDFLHWQTHEYEPYWTIGPPSISTSADAAPYLLSVFIVQVHTDVHVPLPEADLIDEGIDDPDIYHVVAEAIDPVR